MTYVLRAKGETKGHIFYDYDVEDGSGGYYAGCEKMKYAFEFDTKAEAEEKKAVLIDGEDFDIITYDKAVGEYYV